MSRYRLLPTPAQQAVLRDFAQAMKAFFDPGNPAGRLSWRKAGRDEGFWIVGRGRLLAYPGVQKVVVEHRDRLGRVNTVLVESGLAADGRRLVVLDEGEAGDDLVRDMVDVLTWFCARLYRRRSARNRALKAVGCVRRGIGSQAALSAARKDAGHE
jgi:hypothetical protein